MKKLLLLANILMLFIISCKKDETTENNNTTVPPDQLDVYFNNHKQSDQTYVLNATTGGNIHGTGGLDLSFPQNSFTTSNGQVVTGNIDIRLKEFYNKSDFIFNKVYTVSNGRPLISAGAYEIHAFQNGNELVLKSGATYTATFPPREIQPEM